MPGAYGWRPDRLHSGADRAHAARYFIARGFVMPRDTVLDAACGLGAGTALLAQACHDVIGCDVDEGYVASNKKRYQGGNFAWRRLDFEDPGLELPACDVAVSIETIEHLADAQPFVDALFRAARRFIVYTVDTLPSIATAAATGKGTHHKRDYTVNQVDALMQAPGWARVCRFNLGHPRFGVLYKEEACA